MTPRQREVLRLLGMYRSRDLKAGFDSHDVAVKRQAWATETAIGSRIIELVEEDRPACPPCMPSLTTMAVALVAGAIATPIIWLIARLRR